MVDVNLREKDGKESVEIRVDPYPSQIGYKGEYHYRSGSTKQELKGAALEWFLLKKRGRHRDDVSQDVRRIAGHGLGEKLGEKLGETRIAIINGLMISAWQG